MAPTQQGGCLRVRSRPLSVRCGVAGSRLWAPASDVLEAAARPGFASVPSPRDGWTRRFEGTR